MRIPLFGVIEEERCPYIQVLKKRAEKGVAQAQFELGFCYEWGEEGVLINYTEAVKWYERAASQQHPIAQFSLGYCYLIGRGIAKDEIEGLRLIEFNVVELLKAAEKGEVHAQCSVAMCYRYGIGVTKDNEQALFWYQKAAEQGHARAQYSLGICYDDGDMVKKDYVQAVFWYKKAAKQGLAAAQYRLGKCNASGFIFDRGQEYAREVTLWYHKAAERGLAEAQCHLGYCYAKGKGVEQDDIKAMVWYQKAAEQGYAAAQYYLGLGYAKGWGGRGGVIVNRDELQAAVWIHKAHVQGWSDALMWLKIRRWTPLHMAICKGDVSYIKECLYNDYLVEAKNAQDQTPLQLAQALKKTDIIDLFTSPWNTLLTAVRKGDVTSLKAAKIQDLHDWRALDNCATLLMFACDQGQREIVDYLLEKGIGVLTTDEEGNTALHRAAKNKQVHLFKTLCSWGIDVNAINNIGQTALHIACRAGDATAVNILLNEMADPWLRDSKECYPLELAIECNHWLCLKVFLEQDLVKELPDRARAGRTLLHYLVIFERTTLLEEWVSYCEQHDLSVEMDARDQAGLTALHYAVQLGKQEVVEQLLHLGADFYARDLEGNTILHLAVSANQLAMVRWLTSKAEEVFTVLFYAKNHAQQTPLDLAKAIKSMTEKAQQIVTLLQQWNIRLQKSQCHSVQHTKEQPRPLVLHTGRIRNWIFQGGSVKGIAYVGLLKAIAKKGEKHGITLEQIERVGGASVGSITAMLVGIGYTLEQLETTLTGLDIPSFLDGESAAAWLTLKKVYETLPEAMPTLSGVAGNAKRLLGWLFEQVMPSGAVTLTKNSLQLLKNLVPQQLITAGSHLSQAAPAMIALTISPEIRASLHGFANEGGIFPGNTVRDWFDEQIILQIEKRVNSKAIKEKLKKDITFDELHDLRKNDKMFKGLYVTVVNLSTGRVETISHETHGDVIIADAVRASMSIPVVFKPWHLWKKVGDQRVKWSDDLYVDGGVGDNYPIHIFDERRYLNPEVKEEKISEADRRHCYNHETLGFRLVDSSLRAEFFEDALPEVHTVTTPMAFFKALLGTFFNNRYESTHARSHNQTRTVYIDTCGVGMLDFDLTNDRKYELIDTGELAFYDYLGIHAEESLAVNLSKSILYTLLEHGASFELEWAKNFLNVKRLQLKNFTAQSIYALFQNKSLASLPNASFNQTIKFFKDLGMDIETLDTQGYTALERAIAEGDEAYEKLIKAGAKIERLDREGRSLLDRAADLDEKEVPAGFKKRAILALIDYGSYVCTHPARVYHLAKAAQEEQVIPEKYQNKLDEFLLYHLQAAFSALHRGLNFQHVKLSLLAKKEKTVKLLEHYYGLRDQLFAIFPHEFQKPSTGALPMKQPLRLLAPESSSITLPTHSALHYLVFGGAHAGWGGYVGALAQLAKEKSVINVSELQGVGGCSWGALVAFIFAIDRDVKNLQMILQEFSTQTFFGIESSCLITAVNEKIQSVEKLGQMLQAVLPANRFKKHLQQLLPGLGYVYTAVASYTEHKEAILESKESLLKNKGLFSQDHLRSWLRRQLKDRSKDENITFSDFKKETGMDLRLIALDTLTDRVQTFSAIKTPDALVIDAVTAALAIPVLCQPCVIRCKGDKLMDGLFIDASMAEPYPIHLFDTQEHNPQTLGFRLVSRRIKQEHEYGMAPMKKEIVGGTGVIGNLVDFYYSGFTESEHQRNRDQDRTVYIDVRSMQQFEFNLAPPQKKRLYDSGRLAVQHYIQRRGSTTLQLTRGRKVLANLLDYGDSYQVVLRRDSIDINYIRIGKLTWQQVYTLLKSLPDYTVPTLRFLSGLGVNFNSRDAAGKTALHLAIENQEIVLVRLLLKSQLINLTQKFEGNSYLDHAYLKLKDKNEHSRIIEIILKWKITNTQFPEQIIEIIKQIRHNRPSSYDRRLRAAQDQLENVRFGSGSVGTESSAESKRSPVRSDLFKLSSESTRKLLDDDSEKLISVGEDNEEGVNFTN